NNISRIRLIYNIPVLGKKLLRLSQLDLFAVADMAYRHTARKLAGANSEKRNAVTMRRVHSSLNSEYISAELFLLSRINNPLRAIARRRLRRQLQEVFEKCLHAEIVNCAAKENRSELAAQHLFQIKLVAGNVKQLQILDQLVRQIITSHFSNSWIVII